MLHGVILVRDPCIEFSLKTFTVRINVVEKRRVVPKMISGSLAPASLMILFSIHERFPRSITSESEAQIRTQDTSDKKCA